MTAMEKLLSEANKVTDATSFSAFLQTFRTCAREPLGQWQSGNQSLDDVLESLAAWIDDAGTRGTDPASLIATDNPWAFAAHLLATGANYE
ncbi:MAG: hypothetical protein KJO30_14445 [Boseongicola sp.]|nr:hypothetical protein [Boseongicola sp.]NNJ68260.1 hypothetical protein [Boseongicola sp.]